MRYIKEIGHYENFRSHSLSPDGFRALIEPGLGENPDTGSERGAVMIKCRFYGQIFYKNVIGGWMVPHGDAIIVIPCSGNVIFSRKREQRTADSTFPRNCFLRFLIFR